MSEEIYCAKCHNPTEETLLLSCDHNLCINCSAENLSRMEVRGINKTQMIICDLCKSQTIIDSETSKEILTIAMNNQRKTNSKITNIGQIENPVIFNPNQNILNQSNQNSYQYNQNEDLNISSITRFNQVPVNQSNYYQKRELCQEHGEGISYLCFDCLSKCVCSECVVHGIHRNHEVIHIKKAYPIICEKAEQLINHVGEKVKELSAADNTLELKKNEITSVSERCKREIRVAFEDLRNKLIKKEKEIMDKTELLMQDNLQELNTYSRIIQSKIISMNKTIDSIQSHLMRKDDLSLINFYCENKNKILTTSEITELDNMPDLGTLSNLRVDIDKNSFDAMINALNAFHFEITSMKGIDVIKNESAQKYSVRRNLYGINQMPSDYGTTFSSSKLGSSNTFGDNKVNINLSSGLNSSNQNYFSNTMSNLRVR